MTQKLDWLVSGLKFYDENKAILPTQQIVAHRGYAYATNCHRTHRVSIVNVNGHYNFVNGELVPTTEEKRLRTGDIVRAFSSFAGKFLYTSNEFEELPPNKHGMVCVAFKSEHIKKPAVCFSRYLSDALADCGNIAVSVHEKAICGSHKLGDFVIARMRH